MGTDRDDEVFYFNKPPGKKINWYPQVAQHYNKVADRLQPLLIDPIVSYNKLESRVQRAIDLLRKFAGDSTHIDDLTTAVTNLTISQAPVIGQMVWKGLRGGASKTYSGIDFDVAKSALQKYIRRDMQQKAILTAIELYR